METRLEFYLEHGINPEYREKRRRILDGTGKINEDDLIRLVDKFMSKINLVVNVEYQAMRRHSKSYELIPFKDYSQHGECARVYQYFDNRKIIIDYLTDKVFRLVEKTALKGKNNSH